MIREQIKTRIKDLDLTQKCVSLYLGEHEQNLSSFTTGLRPYPYPKFITLLASLGLTVGRSGTYVGEYPPEDIRRAVEAEIEAKSFSRKEVAVNSGVNESTLSLFLNGKRSISVNSLDKLMAFLDLSLVSYKEPKILRETA